MRTLARFVVIVAAGLVAVAATAYLTDFEWAAWRHVGEPRNVLTVGDRQVRIPMPEGPAQRLAPAVAASTTGAHAFMFDHDGVPTRYDPCRPLEWVLNRSGMPDGAEPMLHDAVAEVEAATGLRFDFLGHTDEAATFERALFQERYGDDFAPIIVGWATQEQNTDLVGTVTGLGGSSSVNGAFGQARYLEAGVLVLDSEDVGALMETRSGARLAQAVMMHELAHVIGLAHVDDESELMNENNSTLVAWGPGDLQGLAIAGAGPCQ